MKIKTYVFLLLLSLILFASSSVEASVDEVNKAFESLPSPKTLTLKHDDVLNLYNEALDKYMQSNIRSAYDSFGEVAKQIEADDFARFRFSHKMIDFGFFSLVSKTFENSIDSELSNQYLSELKLQYFPAYDLKKEEEIFLAECYSNIIYNDQSLETANELLKREKLLEKSDYANYIAALAFFKSKNIEQAKIFVDKAVSKNKYNFNYKKLQIEIYSCSKKPKIALKLLENLKKEKFVFSDMSADVQSLNHYVLYTIEKNKSEKEKHLGCYYFYEKNYSKAIKILNNALSMKRADKAYIHGFLSRAYIAVNEDEKALASAESAHKSDGSNSMANLTLGDLKFKNQEYKQALKYYKSVDDTYSYEPQYKIALTYSHLGKDKKVQEIYTKILKNYSDASDVYLNVALENDLKLKKYLKKAIVTNIMNANAWLELANLLIEEGNYNLAQKYLSNAHYIDENNIKYYYYQSLVCKKQGKSDEADMYLTKYSKMQALQSKVNYK